MRIKIQLKRLFPDFYGPIQLIRDPCSAPLAHFNAIYYLQDWILPEHAVKLYKLLLFKIEQIENRYIPVSSHPDELAYCNFHIKQLARVYVATTTIIFELNSLIFSLETPN